MLYRLFRYKTMPFLDTVYESLPEITSFSALVLYSTLAYIITIILRSCVGWLFQDQIDVQARIRQNIIEERLKRERMESQRSSKAKAKQQNRE